MQVVRTDTFTHAGEDYEIRVASDGWNFSVRAFKNGSPANGYKYSVDLPTAYDLDTVTGTASIEELIDFAKNDIVEGRWERVVESHVASLQLKEDEGIGCQKCTKRDIEIKMANGRKLYRCRTCGHVWYGPRGARSGYDHEVDEIAEQVSATGEAEAWGWALVNGKFNTHHGEGPKPPFWDQVRNWCNQNYLDYQVFDKEDPQGKMRQVIRFTRKDVTSH